MWRGRGRWSESNYRQSVLFLFILGPWCLDVWAKTVPEAKIHLGTRKQRRVWQQTQAVYCSYLSTRENDYGSVK